MDNEDFYLDEISQQIKTFLSNHHTSPLTYYPQRLIIEYFDEGQDENLKTPVVKRGVKMCESLKEKGYFKGRIIDDPTAFYTYCLKTANTNGVLASSDLDRQKLRIALETSVNLLSAEAKALETAHPFLERSLSRAVSKLRDLGTIRDDLATVYSLHEFLKTTRNRMQQKTLGKDDTTEIRNWEALTVTHTCYEVLCVQLQGFDDMILINYDQFLMILDAVTSRLVVRLATTLSDRLATDPLPSWEQVSKMYRWGDNLIATHGMHAYKIIGMFEDLVTSVFVNYPGSDPLELGTVHMQTMLADALQVEVDSRIPIVHTTDFISMMRAVGCPNKLSELFGLRKHWGNPMVDAKLSGRAVQEKVDEDFPVDAYALILLLSSFNRMIVVEFIKKHGEWPVCTFPPEAEKYPISVAHRSGNCRLPENSIEHRHEHWAYLTFGVNCIISSFSDSLSLLGDKAVSLPKSKLDHVYERSRQKDPPPKGLEYQRRLILEYLRKDNLTVLEIFKIIMTGDIPDDWLANCANMKGTEMKFEKSRIFAVLTYELRQYFAATEELIKEHIFQYNPHQTMTMNEVDLTTRLRDITSQMDPDTKSKYLHVIHIIDFSKWNLRMKYANTACIFKSIDDFMGTPGLIEASHDIFSRLTNLVQDKYNPPDGPVTEQFSDTIWTLHNRGWEGQRQKGWTVLTSAALSSIERETGVHSEIIGQGDNQVLLSKFKVPDEFRNPSEWIAYRKTEVRSLLDTFYKHMETQCSAIGLKIKTGESCRSLAYFNYGKRLYFNGVELSMTLKRLSKVMTEPNDSYPTSESLLKTMSGTEFAANLYSHPSLIPTLVSNVFNVLQIFTSFIENPLIGSYGTQYLLQKRLSLNTRVLYNMLSIPPSLGGIPTASIISGSYRGHPDPLCEELVALKLRSNSGDVTAKKILEISLSGLWFNLEKDQDKKQLIAAPYSLNLRMPQSAIAPLKHAVSPAVDGYCRNNAIKDLFSPDLEVDEEEIFRWLSTAEPYNPVVMNDIYERSLPGRKKSFVSGLANTTSLNRLVMEDPNAKIIDKVKSGEIQQLEWWIQLTSDVTLYQVSQKPMDLAHHEIAQRLRTLSWSTELSGVCVPHPAEQLIITPTEHGCCGADCLEHEPEKISLVYMSEDLMGVDGTVSDFVQLNRMRGHRPYTGNRVSEGIIQRQVVNLVYSNVFNDVVRLNTVRKWISTDGSNLDISLKKLIRTRTDLSDDIIDKATGTPSRLSHNHRAALMATKKTCAPSSTTNIASRIYISSNQMGKFSHGDENYSLPYGPSFLFGQIMIALKRITTSSSHMQNREIVHMHVRKDDVPVVNDGSIETSDIIDLHQTERNNHPLFIKFRDLNLKDLSGNTLGYLWANSETVTPYQAKLAYATQLLGNSLVEETVCREQIALAIRACYSRREINISIGDLSMVTVKVFVEALAMQIFPLLPFTVLGHPSSESFIPSATDFLDRFSEGFWSQFTSPMLHPRLLRQLIRMSPQSIHPDTPRHSRHLTRVLKDSVVQSLWRVRCQALTSLQFYRRSPVILFAPTLAALRYLYSKWVEAHIMLLSSVGMVNVYKLFAYARDFSHNIQCTVSEDLLPIMAIVENDFLLLNLHLFKEIRSRLLHPTCISTSTAWVDRVRIIGNVDEEEEQEVSSGSLNRSSFLMLDNLWSVSIETGPQLLFRAFSDCHCNTRHLGSKIKTNRYFMDSGVFSKDHLIFSERVCSLNLKIINVICLGTKTGTEAAAFSKFDECENLYVGCLSDLRNYSAHAAATALPTAFYLDGDSEKLYRNTEANLTCGDITADEIVAVVSRHTEGIIWSGLTCSLTSLDNQTLIQKVSCFNNLIGICLNRVEDNGWACFQVNIGCLHELKVLVSVLGKQFRNVNVSYSCFSEFESTVFTLTGVGLMRSVNISNLPPIICNAIDESVELDRLYRIPMNTANPPFCSLNPAQRAQRVRLNNILRPNIKVALDVFLRGFSHISTWETDNRDRCIESIRVYQLALLSLVRDILYAANRIFEGGSFPRSTVLIAQDTELHTQLNNLYQKVHRADLLCSLLNLSEMSFDKVNSIILNWMYEPKYYQMKKMRFQVCVNVSRFNSVFSKHLFEILGNFFKYEFSVDSYIRQSPGLHLRDTLNLIPSPFTSIPYAPLAYTMPVSDLRWSWSRRSEFLSCLIALGVLKINHLKSDLVYPYLSDEITRRLVGKSVIVVTGDTHPDFVNAERKPLSYIREIRTNKPMVILVHLEHIDLIRNNNTIMNMIRPIWAGRVPDTVLLHLLPRTSARIQSPVGFPDFILMSRYISHIGEPLINCSCIDCCSESYLLNMYRISHYALNQCCSIGRISSIREVYQQNR